jgi:uncharacterized protein involved in exopolysaccharide biosynthesis
VPTPASAQTTAPNPSYVTLRDRINVLQQQIASMQARQADVEQQARDQNTAGVDDAKRRLQIVQDQLAATPSEMVTVQTTEPSSTATVSTATSRSTGPNPLSVELQDRSNTLGQEVAALETRRAASSAEVSQRQDELRALVSVDSKLSALNTELFVASNAYAQRASEWSTALVDEARPLAPIRVIGTATEPLYPSWPIKILFVAIGAVAGLFAAILLVFVLYNTDVSLRSTAEAEASLHNLRLLAVVPGTKTASNGHTNGHTLAGNGRAERDENA